jgi:hypothetical protein
MPACGCRGVVHILLTPRHCKISRIRQDSKVSALVTMQLLRYSEVAEVTGNQRFLCCRSLLVGNGAGFQPLYKIVHTDKEVLASLVTSWEGPCSLIAILSNGDPTLYRCIWPITGLAATTGCTGVALLAPLLNIISSLEVVPLSDHIQGLADIQVTSWWSTM